MLVAGGLFRTQSASGVLRVVIGIAEHAAGERSATIRASVVLPEPGGPYRIIEWGRPVSIAVRSEEPAPSRCACPTNACSDRGRTRVAPPLRHDICKWLAPRARPCAAFYPPREREGSISIGGYVSGLLHVRVKLLLANSQATANDSGWWTRRRREPP